MLNFQNLMSQIMSSTNPMQMAMGILNPQQKQMVSQLQNQPSDKQAEAIANYCNQNGISKDQLAQIISMLRRK